MPHARAAPLRWSADQLDSDRLIAIDAFREERLGESMDAYVKEFDRFEAMFEKLLDRTAALARLEAAALELLGDPAMLEGLRYLAGPPISLDDLRVVVGVSSMAPGALAGDADAAARIVQTIRNVLDERRFPWVRYGRQPSETERAGAVIASAALIATQRVQTSRRTTGKTAQEAAVRTCLTELGLTPLQPPKGGIGGPHQWPAIGAFFAAEAILAGRKADVVVRLWDGRLMPIECKVSNSALNSVKRLNNDAAAKAGSWITDLGKENVVPVAVLSGVYNRRNLEDAQNRGLLLVWAHRLSDLTGWIGSAR